MFRSKLGPSSGSELPEEGPSLARNVVVNKLCFHILWHLFTTIFPVCHKSRLKGKERAEEGISSPGRDEMEMRSGELHLLEPWTI